MQLPEGGAQRKALYLPAVIQKNVSSGRCVAAIPVSVLANVPKEDLSKIKNLYKMFLRKKSSWL